MFKVFVAAGGNRSAMCICAHVQRKFVLVMTARESERAPSAKRRKVLREFKCSAGFKSLRKTWPLPRAREGGTLPVSISRGQDERPQRQLPTMSRGVITDRDEPTGPQEDMVPGSEFACLLRFSSLS